MMEMRYPWVLVLLLLPFVLRLVLPRSKEKGALQVPFFDNLQQSFGGGINADVAAGSWAKYLLILIYALVVISGSGINKVGKIVDSPRTGRDLMMLIDLSGSMNTPDMNVNGNYVTRYNLIRNVADDFISKRKGDKLGMILFGSTPYLQTPPTFDLTTVREQLADSSVGIAGPQTAIGDGIGLGVKELMKYPSKEKAMILLTDGANNSGSLKPLEAAKIAARNGIKIYTIGLGATQMSVNSLFGKQTINPSDDLDTDALQQISKLTDGKFFRAKDGNDLQNVYADIDKIEAIDKDEVIVRPRTPYYPYILGLALLLSCLFSFIWIRKNAK